MHDGETLFIDDHGHLTGTGVTSSASQLEDRLLEWSQESKQQQTL